MTKKLVFLKLLLIVFVSFTFQTAFAQTKIKNTIPLAALLNKISNTHEIFFT